MKALDGSSGLIGFKKFTKLIQTVPLLQRALVDLHRKTLRFVLQGIPDKGDDAIELSGMSASRISEYVPGHY